MISLPSIKILTLERNFIDFFSNQRRICIGWRNHLCRQSQHLLETYHYRQPSTNLNRSIISTQCQIKNHFRSWQINKIFTLFKRIFKVVRYLCLDWDRFLQVKKYLRGVDSASQVSLTTPDYSWTFRLQLLLNIATEEDLNEHEQIILFEDRSI